ncbi:vascular endothelial growth factor C [Exaiptasia diaphana]|uniref:Platelet-derived growth factor (PDGF) family profile domain-containing protein n=1 Tax=Exaiptasia diaphana TaxID=2652724 RepID=A0A913XPT9_EXADI|nr:vascular endothelial growth factor C [Exaiptasia diaphana]KXJ10187.1 hypothetical protein AC249_AIPGENE15929 [Exaiptasia diaphana]
MKVLSSILFVLTFYAYVNCIAHSFDSSHAMCKPRLTVLQVDKEFSEKEYVYPYHIQVHQCGGSCKAHPSIQNCKPKTMHEVKIPLYDRKTSLMTHVIIQNHTSCYCDCVKSPMDCRFDREDWKQDQCLCNCRYKEAPPKDLACKAGFRWDSNDCRCRCDRPPSSCPPRKEWNKDACECTCTKRVINRCQRKMKGLDYESCECVDVEALKLRGSAAQPKSGLYISLLIVLAVVVFGLLCVITHLIIKLKRRHSIEYNQERCPSKTSPSMTDSGNMSYSNGSVARDADVRTSHQTDSNGSVHFTTQISRESTL